MNYEIWQQLKIPGHFKFTLVSTVFLMLFPAMVTGFSLQLWLSGFNQITDIQFVENTKQVLVAEKSGALYLVNSDGNEKTLVNKFSVSTDSEHGLLAILPWQGDLLVYYSPKSTSTTRLSRFKIDLFSKTGSMLSNERILLTIKQPYRNHNGGGLAAGKQGEIYLAVGDGGSGGDPKNNGQNARTLLGTLLRIIPDESVSKGYRIPEGNLRDWAPSARPEIFAMGLRNTWRISLSNNGDLFIADVGQNRTEEINIVSADNIGRKYLNFGWNILEGDSCYKGIQCNKNNYTSPIATYEHRDFGQSITGGYLYEGKQIPELKNIYVFADFVSGKIGGIHMDSPNTIITFSKDSGKNWSTFARDFEGELYIADFGGIIYKIVR